MNESIAVDASRASNAARTGTEWYSFEVIGALIALYPRPDLTLYHRNDPGAAFAGNGLRHHVIERRRLWTHLGLSRAMRRDRPAALYVPSHVVPLIHPKASIVTIHDLGYLAEPDAHPRGTRMMLDFTTRWNARVSSSIVAISGQTQQDLVRHYGTKPGKISVVHSGVDHSRFRIIDPTTVNDVLARLGIDRPFIFFLSTVQPRKNLIRLVEAFELINDERLLLVIGGASGWLSGPIEDRVKHSRAASRIRRLGHVTDADVPALYNGAQVFALPSLYEGFGMGVLEAMACGCPVVTSDRSSLPEVAGSAAVLVNPTDVVDIRDGILRARSTPYRQELIAAGLARAGKFEWSTTAAQTLAVIQRAIRDRKS